MKDKKPEQGPVRAEPKTIYRDQAPGKSAKAEADGAVNSALETAGSGIAHDSGATFHDDPTAHAAADALGAKAFTGGSDVYFGAGQYAPGSAGGDSLIQHELTHVDQSRGVAPPEPGNFAVSSPGDAAESAARTSEPGATASAFTLYRDDETTPTTTGTGPAVGGDSGGGTAPTTGSGPSTGHAPTGPSTGTAPTTEDPYDAWKQAVTHFERAQAVSKWSSVPSKDKHKVGGEEHMFQHRVLYVMKKDSIPVIKDGHIDITKHTWQIFWMDDFADWLPGLRTARLLNRFLAASPTKHHMDADATTKLKSWVDAATSAAEAKKMFQKVWPTLHDSASGLPFKATANAWPLSVIRRLYGILAQYMNPGHAATITGGFVYVTVTGGFGWWSPSTRQVALPDSTAAPSNDVLGHDMTGGRARGHRSGDAVNAKGGVNSPTGRRVSPDYKDANGKDVKGAAAQMTHWTGTVLHEVGHGVGARVDGGAGNAYAENAGSWPGFHTGMNFDTWAEEVWQGGHAGSGSPPSVHRNAKLDDEHAKEFFKAEITGKNYSPGWVNNPPRNDMATYCRWKYANEPLQKWWKYVKDGHDMNNSYAWDDESARLRNGWLYSYLTRGGARFTKFKAHTWQQKVSWYSLSSPKEWFAEQYTHFYRTQKSGSGIDSTTLSLLKRLDKQDFAPTSSDGSSGVTIPGMRGGQGNTEGGGISGASSGATAAEAPDGHEEQQGAEARVEPLMFPW